MIFVIVCVTFTYLKKQINLHFAPGCAAGVNVALRQMGNLAKPDLLISVDGNGVVTMKSMSTMKTIEIKFKLDEEFDESTADGRTTKVCLFGNRSPSLEM